MFPSTSSSTFTGGFGGGNNTQNTGSLFGQTSQPTGFGSFTQPAVTSAFGAPSTTTSAFGAPATSAFGSTGFGANNTTSAFGSTAARPFGSGAFGSTAPPATSTAAAGFGGFGTSSTTPSAFGSASTTNTGGLFGSRPAPTGGFGSTGGFGTTTTTPSTFGNTTGGFGISTTNQGTANPPYIVTQDRDPSASVTNVFHSITAMPAYRNWSFEELRMQDYTAGRKSNAPGGTGAFGQPTAFGSTGIGGSTSTFPSSSVFGSTGTGTSTFGANPSTTFSTNPGSFGGSTGTGFGNNNTFATGGFGANTNTSTFGSNTNTGFGSTPASTSFVTGGFGQPTSASTFGSTGSAFNPPKPGGGFSGFGNTGTSTFGSTGSAFGTQPVTSNGGIFGSTATSAPFGSSSTPATGSYGFGTATSQPLSTASGFGNFTTSTKPAQPGFGTFNNNPTNPTTFGSTTSKPPFGGASSGGFGTSTAPGSGLFGNPSSTFGATPAPGATGFGSTSTPGTFGSGAGMFGNPPKQPTTSLFNSTTAPNNPFSFSTTNQPSSSSLFMPSTSTTGGSVLGSGSVGGPQYQQPSLVSSLNTNPYGNNPLFSSIPPGQVTPLRPAPSAIPVGETKKKPPITPTHKPLPKSNSKMNLRGYSPSNANGTTSLSNRSTTGKSFHFFDGGVSEASVLSPQAFTSRPSVKKLVIDRKVDEQEILDKMGGSMSENADESNIFASASDSFFRMKGKGSTRVSFDPSLETAAAESSHIKIAPSPVRKLDLSTETPARNGKQAVHEENRNLSNEMRAEDSSGGYWTLPSLKELRRMSDTELSNVHDFKVGYVGRGQVTFQQPVDLTGVSSLSMIPGHLVKFEENGIVVYEDETTKPAEGQGLNVPAIVSLEKIWPIDKATREVIKDPSHPRFKQHVNKLKKMVSTEFIDFIPDTGTWFFRVKHFSRYGYNDDSDDEEGPEQNNEVSPAMRASMVQRLLAISGDDSSSGTVGRGSEDESLAEGEIASDFDSDNRPPSQTLSEAFSDGDSTAPSSRSHTPVRPTRPIKQSTAWPATLGIEAHKVHLMQASLFRHDEAASNSVQSARTPYQTYTNVGKRGKRDLGQRVRELSHPDSEDEEMENAETRSSFTQSPLIPRLPRPVRKYARVEYSNSLLYDKNSNIVDAGLMMGRSFRVGWGAGGLLVHCGKVVGIKNAVNMASTPDKSTTFSGVPSKVIIERVKFFADDDNIEKDRHRLTLGIHLQNTIIETDEVGIPYAVFAPQTTFEPFVNTIRNSSEIRFQPQEILIWKLGKALFDPIPSFNIDGLSLDAQSKIRHMNRKSVFTTWLQEAVEPAMLKDMQKQSAVGSHAATILSYLTAKQISRACVAAITNRDFRLSTLLAQAGGDKEFRNRIQEQLQIWKSLGFEKSITKDYRKIYELLAGNVGTFTEGHDSKNSFSVAEGLDWKRTLGLYLWYSTIPESPLDEGFKMYEMMAQRSRSLFEKVAKPIPWFMEAEKEDLTIQRLWELGEEEQELNDVLFQIIKIYTDGTYSLEKTLLPRGITPSPLDYRVSWHLFCLFTHSLKIRDFADRIEYIGMPTDEEDEVMDQDRGTGWSYSADALTANLASQLENLGLWEWAIFVSLYLQGAESREVAIRDLLSRNLSLSPPTTNEERETEAFLKQNLKIPGAWINDARAIRARYQHDVNAETINLMSAERWNDVHKLVITRLAPEAVIRDDLTTLRHLLQPLDPNQIENWEIGGELYLNYIECCEQLPLAINSDSRGQNLYDLKRKMQKLLKNLGRVKMAGGIRHSVCIAEMASRVAKMLQDVDSELDENDMLSTLPLPEDQRLLQLHKLSHNYFTNLIEQETF